jgi:CDGSH-type Zn-finger protein
VRHDGGALEPVPTETTVTPRRNGPLFVRGPVAIRNAAGEVIRQDTRMALCRCGQSGNKPFCHGTHRQVGFEAE